jgi:hypothetical protein
LQRGHFGPPKNVIDHAKARCRPRQRRPVSDGARGGRPPACVNRHRVPAVRRGRPRPHTCHVDNPRDADDTEALGPGRTSAGRTLCSVYGRGRFDRQAASSANSGSRAGSSSGGLPVVATIRGYSPLEAFGRISWFLVIHPIPQMRPRKTCAASSARTTCLRTRRPIGHGPVGVEIQPIPPQSR